MVTTETIIHLERMTINFDAPYNMKIDDMEFQQLCILVGQNGSGKSLVLKFNFVLGFIGSSYYNLAKFGIPSDVNELAKFAVKHSFSRPDFTGFIEGKYSGGLVIHITLKDGEVTDCYIMEGEGEMLSPFPMVKFLSTNMRTFDDIKKYLKDRKKLTTANLDDAQFGILLEDYKLYDVLHVEEMIARSPINIRMDLSDYDFPKKPVQLIADPNECDFILVFDDGSTKLMTTFDKGHQSIINMFCAAK